MGDSGPHLGHYSIGLARIKAIYSWSVGHTWSCKIKSYGSSQNSNTYDFPLTYSFSIYFSCLCKWFGAFSFLFHLSFWRNNPCESQQCWHEILGKGLGVSLSHFSQFPSSFFTFSPFFFLSATRKNLRKNPLRPVPVKILDDCSSSHYFSFLQSPTRQDSSHLLCLGRVWSFFSFASFVFLLSSPASPYLLC